MWTENGIFREDLEGLATCAFIPWDELRGKTVFITGATGLIGYTLTSALLYYNKEHQAGLRVVALVRDMERAERQFHGQLVDRCELFFVSGTVEELPEIEGPVDYIIHGACPTTSRFFVQSPVETIQSIVLGTQNVLELAVKKQVSGMVCLSSMEVFGKITHREKLREEELGYIDLFSPRSSYPESKRLAETMSCAYAAEYRVPVTLVRLAQTFGPGVANSDERVFAYMARCAINGEDIRLNTSGAKENIYLYTADAVSAILLLLIKGERGTAYNAGNPETYCSVKEMGEIVARELGNGNISVFTNAGKTQGLYRPEGFLNLDIGKLWELGWKTSRDLRQMFWRMAACF